MKLAIASLLLAAVVLVPTRAHADDVTRRHDWVGADFELLPSGTISGSVSAGGGTISGSNSADVAYGIGVVAEGQVNDLISVGLAPRYVFHVISSNSNGDPASELDLRARVAVGHALVRKLRVYGFAEPGYSVIFPPSNNNNDVHPNGFVLAVGGGAGFAITPQLSGVFELGYQWGFQTWSSTALGTTFHGDFNTSYLSLGFGLVLAID